MSRRSGRPPRSARAASATLLGSAALVLALLAAAYLYGRAADGCVEHAAAVTVAPLPPCAKRSLSEIKQERTER